MSFAEALQRWDLVPLDEGILPDAFCGYTVAVCESTQDIIKDLAEHDGEEWLVVLAEKQHLGRGMRGHSWFSHPSILEFSVLLRPFAAPNSSKALPFLNVLFSYAVLKAFYQQHANQVPAMLKWPNDVLIAGKKVAGVVSELHMPQPDRPYIVLGCGVNINATREDFPDELKSQSTSLRLATQTSHDLYATLSLILKEFAILYRRYVRVELQS